MGTVRYDSNPAEYQMCSFFADSMTGIAQVYIARHTPSNTLVALKKYNLERLTRDEAQLVQNEVILMRQLNHPSVQQLLCSFVSDHKIVCVLPLMGYGSAADLLLRHFQTGLPEQAIATLLKSILQALVYLHSKGIIHRAVRASHILISAEGQVTLTGFKYVTSIISGGRWQRKVHAYPASTMAPNLIWLSPELLQQNLEGYDEKSDVYSLGVTSCELGNGIAPYESTPTTLMLIEKVKGVPRTLMDETTYIPRLEDSTEGADGEAVREEDDYASIIANRRFSNAFHAASEAALTTDRWSRPSAKELLSMPFFKSAPPPPALPKLLIPAVPVLQNSIPDNQEDLESIMASERVNNMELDTVAWDFRIG